MSLKLYFNFLPHHKGQNILLSISCAWAPSSGWDTTKQRAWCWTLGGEVGDVVPVQKFGLGTWTVRLPNINASHQGRTRCGCCIPVSGSGFGSFWKQSMEGNFYLEVLWFPLFPPTALLISLRELKLLRVALISTCIFSPYHSTVLDVTSVQYICSSTMVTQLQWSLTPRQQHSAAQSSLR